MTTNQSLTVYDALQNWINGLENLDYDQIKAALDNNIPANKKVYGKHPLHIVLSNVDRWRETVMEEIMNNLREGTFRMGATGLKSTEVNPQEKLNQHLFKIMDLLSDNGMSYLEPLANTSTPAVESLMLMTNDIIAAKMVVDAIRESLVDGKPYKFDLDRILNNYKKLAANGDTDMASAQASYARHMSFLADIHENVRLTLDSSDESMFEHYRNDLAFWHEDFPMPDADKLNELFPISEEPENIRMTADVTHQGKPMLSIKEEKEIYARSIVQSRASHDFRKKMEEEENQDKLDKCIEILEKEKPEDILKELDEYVGLDEFKASLRRLYIRVIGDERRRELGLPTDTEGYHTAFLGNPGTGKTTCAKFKARFLYSLGLCGPKYAELTRDDIVGKYVGHTENQLKKILDEADIAFIDEAYALADGGASNKSAAFGQVAINTIVGKLGSKDDPFTLFVAGYTDPMKEFIASNRGLKRRIKVFEDMHDYSNAELGNILDLYLDKQNREMSDDAKKYLCEVISKERDEDPKNFGNAGIIVDLVKALPKYADTRLAREAEETLAELDVDSLRKKFSALTAKDLSTITLEDVKGALEARTIMVAGDNTPKQVARNDDNWEPAIGFKFPKVASTAEKNRKANGLSAAG